MKGEQREEMKVEKRPSEEKKQGQSQDDHLYELIGELETLAEQGVSVAPSGRIEEGRSDCRNPDHPIPMAYHNGPRCPGLRLAQPLVR